MRFLSWFQPRTCQHLSTNFLFLRPALYEYWISSYHILALFLFLYWLHFLLIQILPSLCIFCGFLPVCISRQLFNSLPSFIPTIQQAFLFQLPFFLLFPSNWCPILLALFLLYPTLIAACYVRKLPLSNGSFNNFTFANFVNSSNSVLWFSLSLPPFILVSYIAPCEKILFGTSSTTLGLHHQLIIIQIITVYNTLVLSVNYFYTLPPSALKQQGSKILFICELFLHPPSPLYSSP